MIDIHCHLLPGLDDGPKDLTESLRMAQQAVLDGIDTIIATPHHKNGQYNNPKSLILDKVQEMNQRLIEENIKLTILPGQEVRIFGELLDEYKMEEILPLNNGGQYLFIEFPSNHVPRYTKKLIYDIQLNGLIPIIVHPERNREMIADPELLFELVRDGALTQVTASSITGFFGKAIQKFSMQLIEAELTHFIASDAHNTTNRPFQLAQAYGVIEKKYGMNRVYYFQENAQLLVSGKNVYKEEPHRVKRKKLLGIF